MGCDDKHIVMLPFMAQGHLIPFLALARQIHQRTSFKITIATTPLNIQYLRPTINSSTDNIHLAELSFCSTDYGLPPNTENTENLPLSKIVDLYNASVSLEAPCRRLISDIIEKEGRPPLCIISDVFFGWANNLANSLGTVNVTFTTCGAYGTAAYMSIWLNLPHHYSTASDKEFTVPWFPERCRFDCSQLHPYLRAANGQDSWSRFFHTQLALSMKSFGWLCNTVEEVEPFGLEILRNFLRLPVWSVGPLLPTDALKNSANFSVSRQQTGRELGIPAEKCFKWLDSHPRDSVIYISFGSQNTISASQMMELAVGLEESGRPFIWVIRPPFGNDLKGDFREEWLPQGFEDRMSESKQGLVVHNWAPQLEILAHKSTSAFVSHCGWNSVMESLSQGVPIIGWPLAAEQAYNSKMLVEEMGVSVELTRGVQSVIVREEVKRVIDLVMDQNGKGGEMKKRAVEMKEKMRASVREDAERKGSSVKAMDDFVFAIL